MHLHRRQLLLAGLGVGSALAAGLPARARTSEPATAPQAEDMSWEEVRALFPLEPQWAHLSGFLLASHPRPVQQAISQHRQALDSNPAHYVRKNNRRLESRVRQRAARYLGARPEEIALTDSTTMGLGLVYNGLRVRSGQELLTTEHDYHVTHRALGWLAERSGATVRKVRLYSPLEPLTEQLLVERLLAGVTPHTRVVALTWVHSSTGVKLPLQRMAHALARLNASREPHERMLLCVDAVHALGVEPIQVHELGVDFLVAGTHKWLFGPRGTGLVWGHPRAHSALTPTIPTFSRHAGWGGNMTPGGFHSFEHRWALAEAFELHQGLGPQRVSQRIHALNRQLKQGLALMPHIRLYTPLEQSLSAGITCFDVRGMPPSKVVSRLERRGIIASRAPYRPSYARLAPGLLNTPGEVEYALAALRALAPSRR